MSRGSTFEEPRFFARFAATAGRVTGAFVAIGLLALGAELGERRAFTDLLDMWLLAAAGAVGVGMVASSFVGLVRLVM